MSKQKTDEAHTFDNVFYDKFFEMREHYSDYITEIWEETKTVCMAHTNSEIGLFGDSDIIAVYDENDNPSVITERIYRKNYSWREWLHIKRILKDKVKWIGSEMGFDIRVTTSREFVDFIHYKEEWWEWARKIQQK